MPPGVCRRDTARLATATGRAAVEVVRHPEAVLDRARRLPLAVPMLRQAVTPILTGRVADWRGEYAYTAGMQAFIYGFPYIYNAQLRHDWVTQARDPAVVPYAAVNHFWHAARLMDATYRDGGCPNNDTLYSLAWLDLQRRAGHPVPPGHGRALLHLRADGVHLGQRRLRRAAHHRQHGRALRHRRAGLAGRAAARGPGQSARADPVGPACWGAPWSTATRTCRPRARCRRSTGSPR